MNQSQTQDRNALSNRELLAWAWRETPPVHRHGVNLLIHIVAVPAFVAGHIVLLAGLVLSPWLLLVGLLTITVSYGVQGVGHALEQNRPPPFVGPWDFVRRVYAEQMFNFWRFLGSGQWHASLRAARRRA